MSYIDNLRAELRDRYGLSDEALQFVMAELVESFKNGLKRGRGREAGTQLDRRRPSPRLSRNHG